MTGVLNADFWVTMEPTMLFRFDGGSSDIAAGPSRDKVGGVGGRPLSAPFSIAGDASGVDC